MRFASCWHFFPIGCSCPCSRAISKTCSARNRQGNSFKSDPANAVPSVFGQKTPPTGAVVVHSNPRLEGKNLDCNGADAQRRSSREGNRWHTVYRLERRILDPGYDRGAPGYPCWAQKAFADGTP